jgi:hypothetical protein
MNKTSQVPYSRISKKNGDDKVSLLTLMLNSVSP